MHHLLEIWFGWVQSGGYLGIFALMAMESSLFPVPSEVVIPPAAFLAAQGHLNYWGVIASGTAGSYFGAAVTYWVSLVVGRRLIASYGHYLLMGPEKVARAEVWLHRYEAGGIFFARLLPVIRHLISIPAGIVRMSFATFSLMTILGSAIWCYILAYLGDQAFRREPKLLDDPEAMVHFIKHQSHWVILFVLVLALLYAGVMRATGKPADKVGAA